MITPEEPKYKVGQEINTYYGKDNLRVNVKILDRSYSAKFGIIRYYCRITNIDTGKVSWDTLTEEQLAKKTPALLEVGQTIIIALTTNKGKEYYLQEVRITNVGVTQEPRLPEYRITYIDAITAEYKDYYILEEDLLRMSAAAGVEREYRSYLEEATEEVEEKQKEIKENRLRADNRIFEILNHKIQ